MNPNIISLNVVCTFSVPIAPNIYGRKSLKYFVYGWITVSKIKNKYTMEIICIL